MWNFFISKNNISPKTKSIDSKLSISYSPKTQFKWKIKMDIRNQNMLKLLPESGPFYPGDNPLFPLVLKYDKSSKPPQIINSGIIVYSKKTNKAPLLDGFIDDIYGDPVELSNDYYLNLNFYSIHDKDNIYIAISFKNEIEMDVYSDYYKWETTEIKTSGYGGYTKTDEKRYNPFAFVFLDIYWEKKYGMIENILSRKECDLDLWCWQPSFSLGRFLDDRNYKILFKLDKFPKDEPKFCFLSKGFTAVFINAPDNGILPYIYGTKPEILPNKYIGDIISNVSPFTPSKSCADIESRWSFDNHINDLYFANLNKGNGTWVIEIRRKLNTGHSDDVDFTSRKKFRFFIPYFINLYSQKLLDEHIYPPKVIKNLEKTNPYYTLEIK